MTRESDPYTGHASRMSSATPAAFWSAMSMMTTSASDLSATPRATVAPTFPAPPTTVTFRFIKSTLQSLHVLDDGVRELGRFQFGGICHLTREVIGDPFLADSLFQTALDQGSRFVPAEIVEHHHARQNDRPGVDDV